MNQTRFWLISLRFSVLTLFLNLTLNSVAQIIPLYGAHAHNDYQQGRPLFDALENGFTSIEVDVLLIEDELYVGHDYPENAYHRLPTLLEQYLLPLDSVITHNRDKLYPGYDSLCYLMIDIKTDGNKTYDVLMEQLRPFSSWIYHPDKNLTGSILVFLSGNRPMDRVINESNSILSLDGRPEDLGMGFDSDLMPVISQAYYRFSSWRGEGEMPDQDQEVIKKLANKAHLEGKKLRLWAIPDNPKAWKILQDLGVDFINSDDLEGLSNYLLNK